MNKDKYSNETSLTVARIIEKKCPNIKSILEIIQVNLNRHEKIEICYWTDSYLHIWVNDARFKDVTIAMRMMFSVDFENDIVLYKQPYTGQNGFASRSIKWNGILKKCGIVFDKYVPTFLNKT